MGGMLKMEEEEKYLGWKLVVARGDCENDERRWLDKAVSQSVSQSIINQGGLRQETIKGKRTARLRRRR